MAEIKGSLLITDEGIETVNIPEVEREKAIIEFYDMKQEAERCNDRFYALASVYSHTYSYGVFYPSFLNMSWQEFQNCDSLKGVGQRAFQLMQCFCQRPNISTLHDERDFLNKEKPRTGTGYYNSKQVIDFVGNIEEWENWHKEWFIKHPESIDWSHSSNDLFPRPDLIIKILRRELLKNFLNENNSKKAHDVSQIMDVNVANEFHEHVMKHKGDKLEAYASIIGCEICQCNFYKFEKDLSDLEQQYAKSLRNIYSIIKNGKMQFISIDFKHGMFEFHDENGAHQGEFRFDGSFNSASEQSHSLKCVKQWRRQYGIPAKIISMDGAEGYVNRKV